MAKRTTEIEVSETHKKIVKIIEERGIKNFHGGIQLFANQFDTEYSVSINYMSTGIHIPVDDVILEELIGDELIQICKTYECVI